MQLWLIIKGQSEVYAAVKQDKEYVVKEIPVTKGIESATNAEIEGADLSDGMIILSEPSSYSVGSSVTISDEQQVGNKISRR